MNAVRAKLGTDIAVSGCFFHFCQSTYRKVPERFPDPLNGRGRDTPPHSPLSTFLASRKGTGPRQTGGPRAPISVKDGSVYSYSRFHFYFILLPGTDFLKSYLML